MQASLPLNIFPNPNNADEEGLVAYGGDLTPKVVLSAYLQGIFPWYNEGEPYLWWSPDPRMIVYPEKFKVSKSLHQKVKRGEFEVRFDTNFNAVIRSCSHVKREGQAGTWITDEMIMVYNRLHEMGFAHSVETYLDDELVGGLYGLSLGKVFCGESMFHKVSDASKVAFYYLVDKLKELNYSFIDAQVPTQHLKSLGGEEVPRSKFLEILAKSISLEVLW